MASLQFSALSATYILIYVCCILGAPLDDTGEMTDSEITNYLERTGYLNGETDPQIGALTDHSAKMEIAIRKFQNMAGLEETGKMDQETIRWMKLPRCGVPDEISRGDIAKRRRKRFAVQGSKWGRNRLTYKILNFSPDMTAATQRSEVARAFAVWSEHSPLTFTEVGLTSTADIEIKFAEGSHGDSFPFDGRGGTLAHAFFPQFGGDAHIDDAETFTAKTSLGTNLFQVLAHEFGHSLGLGHSSNRNALMAPFYRGYVPSFVLHSDDIAGIQQVYGPPSAGTTTTTTRRPASQTRAPTAAPNPDICMDGTFDAIARFEEDTYLFRGNMYAKLNNYGLESGYPRTIQKDWPGLPDNLDAALYWPLEFDTNEVLVRSVARTYFFKGPYYWRYEKNGLASNYPKLISVGFPGLPNDIDAAFVWSGNGKTYFIKDQQYYRYTRGKGVDSNYPKPLSVWDGLPSNIDAAFQWQNGRTYFFNGPNYYRFNDRQFTVDTGYPRLNSIWWLGCPDSANNAAAGIELSENDDQFLEIDTVNDTSGASALGSLSVVTMIVIVTASFLY